MLGFAGLVLRRGVRETPNHRGVLASMLTHFFWGSFMVSYPTDFGV